MAYLDSFNPEQIDSVPEVRQQFRFLKKAIDAGEIGSGGGGAVDSVNGKTGVVVLNAKDVGAASVTQVQSVADDVATNTEDIANLQAAYAGLTQSDIVPLDTLPASGEANTIYRVAGTGSYSDYMWDGSDFVLMATYSNMSGDGVYDISAEHSGATYDNITAALGSSGANVPTALRKGGMSVKYIENIYAEYGVVVTEGLTTEPTGTLLESTPSITSGIYKAAQLSAFSTLPDTVGATNTYYIAVTGDTTTYTTWVITKNSSDGGTYVVYRLTSTVWSSITGYWEKLQDSVEGSDFAEISTQILEIRDNQENNICSITDDGLSVKDIKVPNVGKGYSSLKDFSNNQMADGKSNQILESSSPIEIFNDNDDVIVKIDEYGVHSPTIQEKGKLYDAYIIPSYGQSLAIGTGGGATTFSSVEQYAYNENLAKTDILDMEQGIAEGFRLAAIANNITMPNRTKVITFHVGTGGISVKGLSKGGTYGYNTLLEKISTAKQNCDANGLSCVVPAIAWTQGEEDMRCGGVPSRYGTEGYEPTEYHNSLISLIEDLNTDIKAITGQKEDIVFVTYQTSSHTSYKRYPRIALEQGLADNLSNKVFLVKPNYNVEYVREGSSSDPGTSGLTGFEVHCPNKSYRDMGNHYGIAAFEVAMLRKAPSRCYPKSFFVKDNTIVIRFNVPKYPLVFDTTNISNLADGNYGFCVYNVSEGIGETGTISKATTIITSVSITDIDEVTITFSREPQDGEVLTYGINGDYWVNIDGTSTARTDYEVDDGITKSGKEHGSRGCLRDSETLENNNSGAVYHNMFNWCRIFEYKF